MYEINLVNNSNHLQLQLIALKWRMAQEQNGKNKKAYQNMITVIENKIHQGE